MACQRHRVTSGQTGCRVSHSTVLPKNKEHKEGLKKDPHPLGCAGRRTAESCSHPMTASTAGVCAAAHRGSAWGHSSPLRTTRILSDLASGTAAWSALLHARQRGAAQQRAAAGSWCSCPGTERKKEENRDTCLDWCYQQRKRLPGKVCVGGGEGVSVCVWGGGVCVCVGGYVCVCGGVCVCVWGGYVWVCVCVCVFGCGCGCHCVCGGGGLWGGSGGGICLMTNVCMLILCFDVSHF